MNELSKNNLWVIDFEASGLSKKSYPIQVGVTNGTTEYQSLIKPLRHWQHWDLEAAKIHNIPYHMLLDQGRDTETVAQELNEILAGQVVYCDSIEWDGFWGNVLFSDSGIHQKLIIKDIKELLNNPDSKLSRYLETKEALEKSGDYTLHSALDDAKIIWRSLISTCK